jgi:membrane-bound lytic murein transglycosylase MltF
MSTINRRRFDLTTASFGGATLALLALFYTLPDAPPSARRLDWFVFIPVYGVFLIAGAIMLTGGFWFSLFMAAVAEARADGRGNARRPAETMPSQRNTAIKAAGVAIILMVAGSSIGASSAEQHAAALGLIIQPWTGDFDGMVQRRRIRILTPYDRTHYYIDKGIQRGVIYDAGVQLEAAINRRLKTTAATRVHVAFVPTPRSELYHALIDGRGDVIATNITMTPERARLVDFAVPGRTNVKEVIVTGREPGVVRGLDDLSGAEVSVRENSIEFDSLAALNRSFAEQGKAPVIVRTVSADLTDEDILEMVNAGLLKAAVVDDFVAEFWSQVLDDLTVHPDVVVRREVAVGWAVRKGSPRFIAELNPFIEAHRPGTLFGNTMMQKYLRATTFVRRATARAELAKFETMTETFRRYADRYNLDYLLMMAQGYHESGFDQRVSSRRGAIGVMQVMPATGRDLAVGDVRQLDSNVHAGVKYIRLMIDRYFDEPALDPLTRTLFALAAYNCGPGRVRELRKEAARRGLNADRWFGNVERIADDRVGRQTVDYVSSIYKYYVAYRLTIDGSRSRGMM